MDGWRERERERRSSTDLIRFYCIQSKVVYCSVVIFFFGFCFWIDRIDTERDTERGI